MKNKKRIRCGFCFRLQKPKDIKKAKFSDWTWECKNEVDCIEWRERHKRQ